MNEEEDDRQGLLLELMHEEFLWEFILSLEEKSWDIRRAWYSEFPPQALGLHLDEGSGMFLFHLLDSQASAEIYQDLILSSAAQLILKVPGVPEGQVTSLTATRQRQWPQSATT